MGSYLGPKERGRLGKTSQPREEGEIKGDESEPSILSLIKRKSGKCLCQKTFQSVQDHQTTKRD